MTQPYLAFLLLLAFVAFNAALLIGLSHLVAPRKPTVVKDAPYESGMPPLGSAHERFSVKFYLVAKRSWALPSSARGRALLGEVLPRRDAVHHLRPRDGVPDPVGRDLLRRGGPGDGVSARGDAGVHAHPRGGLRLCVEAGGVTVGLRRR